MASSITGGVSPPPLSPVLSDRHTSRSGDNFLGSPQTEKREGHPFSSRPSPCHASSSSYLPSADNRSSETDSPSKRRAVCPVFIPSLRLSEANLSSVQPGRDNPVAGSGLLSASFQSRGSSSPQRTSSSGSGVSACFNSPARGCPVSSMEGSHEAQCFSRDGSPRAMNVSSSGVCTPGLASDQSGSSTEFPSQLLWVAIPLTHASSPSSSSMRNEHLNLSGSSAALNENTLSTATARPHRAEVKSECTYTPTSELAKFHPESGMVTTPHVTRETIARTIDEVLRKAPMSSVRSAIESGMKTSLICSIDPLVNMSRRGGEPGVADNDVPSSSLRSLVQKQRLVVLASSIPSPRATSSDPSALSSSFPLSLESLLRDIKVREDERSSVEVLREQNRKLEEILGKTTSQGELKRDLWRLQLLQIQQQSQLRKQTAKMIEALEACRSLLSITGATDAGMPMTSVASSEKIDSREEGHDDASNTKDSDSPLTGDSAPTKDGDRNSIAFAKVSELLALIEDAINLGGGGAGVMTGGGRTTSSNTSGGAGMSSSQGPGLWGAGRGGGDSRLVHPSSSSSSSSTDHFNPPHGFSSSFGSPHDEKSGEGGSRGVPQRGSIEEDYSVSGTAQRTTPARHHLMLQEADQRQNTPSSSMSQYSSTPQGGGHGKTDSSSAFPAKAMTGITGRGGGVPPLAMGFLTNQHSHRSGHMDGREGALSPALSRDYSRRFSSRASFSSSVSLTNNSCSSLCTSRSDLSTYRGNNNLSGDEAGGGEGGVLRRREHHSSRVTPPSHGERNKSATTFVSKWKGRPVFVPRLNLTGEDDEEEDQGTGEDGGQENSIMSLFAKEGEGTRIMTSGVGGSTAVRVEEDRRGGEEGGQAHPKRGERQGGEGTSPRGDSPESRSRSDQRRREMHVKESESMCTPAGKDQQVVGGPGGGSAKIEATWRLQQHLLQQRHGVHYGSPGRASESISNSPYVADQFQSSTSQGRYMLSPQDSHTSPPRLNTAPGLSSSSSRERECYLSRIEEGERGSPSGGQEGGREHDERYKRQGEGLDEKNEQRKSSCSSSPSPSCSRGMTPHALSPSLIEPHSSYRDGRRLLLSPSNDSSRHESRYTYSCSSHNSSGSNTYRRDDNQSTHHSSRDQSECIGGFPYGSESVVLGPHSQRRVVTATSVSSSHSRGSDSNNTAHRNQSSYSRTSSVMGVSGVGDAVGGGGGPFGSRQTTSSPALQSPVTSPSSFKTHNVSGPLSPSVTTLHSGGGSSSLPLARQSDRKTDRRMSGGRTADGVDIDHDLHQQPPGRPHKATSHSHGSCGSHQRQGCFDAISPHSSVKSSESPPVSPGGRRRHCQRDRGVRGSPTSSPPSPPRLVPCSSLGKSPRAYISPRGVCGVSYTGSLSPSGSARSPFSPGHQAFSARGGGHQPTSASSGGGGGGLLASPRSGSILVRSSPDPRTISMASAVSAGVAASVAVAVAAATRQRNEGEGGNVTRDISSPRIHLADHRNGSQRGSTNAPTQGTKPLPDHGDIDDTSSSIDRCGLDSKKSPRKGDETASRCGVSTGSRGSQAPQSLVDTSSSHGVSPNLNLVSSEDSHTPKSTSGRTDSERARTPRVHQVERRSKEGQGRDRGTGETGLHSLSSDARGGQGEGDVGTPCMNRQSTLSSVDDATRDCLQGVQMKASAFPTQNVAMLHRESCPPSRDVSDTVSRSRGSCSHLQRDDRAESCASRDHQASTAPREFSSAAGEQVGGDVACQISDSSGGRLSGTTHNLTEGEGRDSSAEKKGPAEGDREAGGKAVSSSPLQVTLKELRKPVSEDDENPERRQDRKIQTARGSRPTSSYGAGSEGNSSSSHSGSGSFSVSGGVSRFVRSNSFSGGIPDNTNSPQLSGGGRGGEAEGERGGTFRNVTNNVNSHGRPGNQSPFSLSSSFSSVSVAELRKAFESRHSQHSFKKTPSIPSPPSISRATGGGGGGRGGTFSTAGGKDSSAGNNSHEMGSKTRMFLRSFSSLESSSGRFSLIEGRGGSPSSFLPQGKGGGEGEDGERGDRGRAVSGASSYDENSSSEKGTGRHHEGDKVSLSSPSLSVSSRDGGRDDPISRDSRQGQHRTFFSNTGQVSRMVLSLSSTSKSSQYEDDRQSSSSCSDSRLGSSKYSYSSHEGGSNSGCDEDERGHVEEGRMKKNTSGVRKLNSLHSSSNRSVDTNTAVARSNKPSQPLSTRKDEEVSSVPEGEGMVSLSLSTSSAVGEISERGRKTKERGEGDTKRDGGGVGGGHHDGGERGRMVPPFKKEISEMKKPGSEVQNHSDEGRRSVPVFTRQALFGEEDRDEMLPSNREKKRREEGGDDNLDHDENESHTQRRRRPDESGDPEREEGLHKKKGRRLEDRCQLEKKDDCKEGTGGKHPSGEGNEERKEEGSHRYEGSRSGEREKGNENAEVFRETVGLVQSSSASSLSSGEVRLSQQDLGLNLSFSFSSYPSSDSDFSSSSSSNSAESFSHGPTSQTRHTLISTQAETTRRPPGISDDSHQAVSAVAATASSSSFSLRAVPLGGSEGDHPQLASRSSAPSVSPPAGGETRSHSHSSSLAPPSQEEDQRASHPQHHPPHQDPNAPLAYYVLGTTAPTNRVILQREGGIGFHSFATQKEDGEEKADRDMSSFQKASVKDETLEGGGGGKRRGEEGWWEHENHHFHHHVDLLQHKERLVQLGVDPNLVLRGDYLLLSSLLGAVGRGYDDRHLSGSKYDLIVELLKQRRREGHLSSLPTATTTDSFEVDTSSLPFMTKREVQHDDCISFSTSLAGGKSDHHQAPGGEILKFLSNSVSSVVEKPKDSEGASSRELSSAESREFRIRTTAAGVGEGCFDTSVPPLPMGIAVVAEREKNRRVFSDVAMNTLSTVSTEESLRDLPQIQPNSTRPTPADDLGRGDEAGGDHSMLLRLLSAERAEAGDEESQEKEQSSKKPVSEGDDAHKRDHQDEFGESSSVSSIQQGKEKEESGTGKGGAEGDFSCMSYDTKASERIRVVKKDEASVSGECSSRGFVQGRSEQVKGFREEERQRLPGEPSSIHRSPGVGREKKEQDDKTFSNGISTNRTHVFGEVDDEGKGMGEKEQAVDVHNKSVFSRGAVCQWNRGTDVGEGGIVECFDVNGRKSSIEECVPLIKSEEGRTSSFIPLKSEQVVHPYITITNHYQGHIPSHKTNNSSGDVAPPAHSVPSSASLPSPPPSQPSFSNCRESHSIDRHGHTSQFPEVLSLGDGNGGGDSNSFSSSTEREPVSVSFQPSPSVGPFPVAREVPGDRRRTTISDSLTASAIHHHEGGYSHPSVSSGMFALPQRPVSCKRGMKEGPGVFSYQESQHIRSWGGDTVVGGISNSQETAFGVPHSTSSVSSENVALPPLTQWSSSTYTYLAPNTRSGGAGGVSYGGGRSHTSPTTSYPYHHPHHPYSTGFPFATPFRAYIGRPSPFPYVGGDMRGANRARAVDTRPVYPSGMLRGRADGPLVCPTTGWRLDREEIQRIPQMASFRYPSLQSSSVMPPPSSSCSRRVSDVPPSRYQQERYFGPAMRPCTAGGVVSPDIRDSFFHKPSSPSSFAGLSRGDTFTSVPPAAVGLLDPPTALLPLLFPSPPRFRNRVSNESSTSSLGDSTIFNSTSGSGERREMRGEEGVRGEGFASIPFSEVSSCVSSLGSEVISLLQDTRDLSSSPTDSSKSQRRHLPSPSAMDKDQERRVCLPQEKADKRVRDCRVRSPVNDRNSRDWREGRREQELSSLVKEEINPSHSRQTHDVADSSRLSENRNAAGLEESFSYFSSFPSRRQSDRSSGISVQITPSLSMAVDVVTRVDIAAGTTPGAPFTRHVSWSVPPPNIRRRRRRAGKMVRQAGWKVACGEFYGNEEEEESVEESQEERRECVAGLSEFWSQLLESRSFRLDAPSSFSFPSALSSQGGSNTREGRAVLSATANAGHPSQTHDEDSVTQQQQEQSFFQEPPQAYRQQGLQHTQQTPLVLPPSHHQRTVFSDRQDRSRYADAPLRSPPEGLFSCVGSQQQQNPHQGTLNQSFFYLPTGHSSAVLAQSPHSLLQQQPGGLHSAVQAHRISHGEVIQQATASSEPCQFPVFGQYYTNSSPLNQHFQKQQQGEGGDGGGEERFHSEDVSVPR